MVRREALGKGIGALFSEQEEDKKSPEQSVITSESEVISKKSEVDIPESLVITNESEVTSEKSEVDIPESSLITSESEVNNKKSGVITLAKKKNDLKQKFGGRGLKNRQRSTTLKTNQMIEVIDLEILEQAITEALASPRISTWSPLVMSALRYLQLTTARFSMSKEVSETLESAFKQKYPNLLEKIENELGQK